MKVQGKPLHIQNDSHMTEQRTRTLAFEKELTSWSLHFTYASILAELNTSISQKDSTLEVLEAVYKQGLQ